MTDPHNREADTPETDGLLLEEASVPPHNDAHGSNGSDTDLPAASADAPPLPATEPEHPESLETPETPEDTAPLSAEEHAAAHEEGQEEAGAPVPAQQLSDRVDALERQVEVAQDRARLMTRVQALRKKVEEGLGEESEERADLLARLQRLEGLCQEHLDENFRRKEALTLKAEELSPSEEWKSTAEAIKALQAEWKTIGPVPQERSQELWQRFRKAGNSFFERLQEHRKEAGKGTEENLRKKEELCARAEELSTSTDWKGAAEAIKALQAEWKTVGPAPREQADAVWKRFRAAADVFFERRKEHSDKLRKEQEENLRKKEALVGRAEELSQSTQWKATVQAIKDLQAEWRTVGPAPSNKAESVWRRFRAAIDLFFERQATYFAQRNQDLGKRQDQMLDALERKREQANRVRESMERDEENVKRWQANLANFADTADTAETHDGDRSGELRASLEAKIADVESKLPEKRKRLDELEATIQEIAAKLK